MLRTKIVWLVYIMSGIMKCRTILYGTIMQTNVNQCMPLICKNFQPLQNVRARLLEEWDPHILLEEDAFFGRETVLPLSSFFIWLTLRN